MRATHMLVNVKSKGRDSTYTAWFDGSPLSNNARLLGSERTDRLGRVYPVTTKQWDAIARGKSHGEIRCVKYAM